MIAQASASLIGEIEAFYVHYLDRFRAGDSAALAGMAVRPMARIGADAVSLVDTPPDPAALKARTGWHDTVEVDVTVLDATPARAHLRLNRAVRVRADGSAIETIAGFYALVRQDGAWKILAVSVVATPVKEKARSFLKKRTKKLRSYVELC